MTESGQPIIRLVASGRGFDRPDRETRPGAAGRPAVAWWKTRSASIAIGTSSARRTRTIRSRSATAVERGATSDLMRAEEQGEEQAGKLGEAAAVSSGRTPREVAPQHRLALAEHRGADPGDVGECHFLGEIERQDEVGQFADRQIEEAPQLDERIDLGVDVDRAPVGMWAGGRCTSQGPPWNRSSGTARAPGGRHGRGL